MTPCLLPTIPPSLCPRLSLEEVRDWLSETQLCFQKEGQALDCVKKVGHSL